MENESRLLACDATRLRFTTDHRDWSKTRAQKHDANRKNNNDNTSSSKDGRRKGHCDHSCTNDPISQGDDGRSSMGSTKDFQLRHFMRHGTDDDCKNHRSFCKNEVWIRDPVRVRLERYSGRAEPVATKCKSGWVQHPRISSRSTCLAGSWDDELKEYTAMPDGGGPVPMPADGKDPCRGRIIPTEVSGRKKSPGQGYYAEEASRECEETFRRLDETCWQEWYWYRTIWESSICQHETKCHGMET